jgi:hypothetical protein
METTRRRGLGTRLETCLSAQHEPKRSHTEKPRHSQLMKVLIIVSGLLSFSSLADHLLQLSIPNIQCALLDHSQYIKSQAQFF